MMWRANITNILRHQDDLLRLIELIEDCSKVKDAKNIYGEFYDEDTAEAIDCIDNLIRRIFNEGSVMEGSV